MKPRYSLLGQEDLDLTGDIGGGQSGGGQLYDQVGDGGGKAMVGPVDEGVICYNLQRLKH